MSYNLKVWNYGDGKKQLRIYNKAVKTDFERKKEDETVEKIKLDDGRVKVVSNNRAKQKIYELARANKWEYFITLTFAKDRYDYDLLTKKLSKWINNVKRDYAPNMKYVFVPELHKDGALHFHGIVADVGSLPLKDSGHKDKDGKTIYNIDCYKMGFTTATQVTHSGRVASYITKYITKELMTYSKGKKKYWASRNLNKPDICEYHIDYDDIQQFLVDNTDFITYEKTIDNPMNSTKIRIVEIDENAC